MNFILTDNEIGALESFKSHCESTVENIDDYLASNAKGYADKDLLYYIYADNARGIVLEADWNVMHNEIRTIQELNKRYSDWEDEQ